MITFDPGTLRMLAGSAICAGVIIVFSAIICWFINR